MKHQPWNLCTLCRQKDNNVRTMYVLILSSRMVTSSTIFGGNNMPMCLIADTPFPKAWTTLWTVTICIASTSKECLLVRVLTVHALVSVLKELQTRFWCGSGLWPNNGTTPKTPFLASSKYEAFQSLGTIFALQFPWLLAMPSNCCVLIWFQS